MTKRSLALVALCAVGLAACDDAATVANRNITRAADNFEVHRRVVFINGITGQYILTVEGRCSLSAGESARSIRVTCKTGPSEYLRHQIGLSDNVTFLAEQIRDVRASEFRYRVTFNPLAAVPDINVRMP
jgi:hypothetical protein